MEFRPLLRLSMDLLFLHWIESLGEVNESTTFAIKCSEQGQWAYGLQSLAKVLVGGGGSGWVPPQSPNYTPVLNSYILLNFIF